ncbi:glutamine amidotransferase [Candidatus Saccharibacteria bacterium]|jgi:GMP synthase (glutamine-hydrolysing)|nr:glutamine amidotransferase [Candidatus Saccharibacteria bacterium]
MKKLFLVLQIRPEDIESDSEFKAIVKFSGLTADNFVRYRIETTGLPAGLNFRDYAGVIVGGGPSNISTPNEDKYPGQKIFEPQLLSLVKELVENDYPYLGCCYGLGLLAYQQGGIVNNTFSEEVGAVQISLDKELVVDDPIFGNLEQNFYAYVGHKEACFSVPASVKIIGTSENCPIQAIKVKNNLYATQFHPELDHDFLAHRINVYKHHGYFKPEESDELIEKAKQFHVSEPMKILKNFVGYYSK